VKSVRTATAAAAALLALALAACASSSPEHGASASSSWAPVSPSRPPPAAGPAPAAGVPQPAHIVVVVFENRSFGQVIGSPAAPYMNELAHQGALFTHSYAITHPSEPNYLALFSGSTFGVQSDSCPENFNAANLASGLLRAGKTFVGFAEDLPAAGSKLCLDGEYARKHVPWADFTNIPPNVSQPFSSFPVGNYSALPTVSFVIPNLCNDMHDCSINTGDSWLRKNLNGYVTWAITHDSLLIVTFDEDDGTSVNQIPTIFVGQQVRPGSYPERITHYTVLATIEAAYGLPRDGAAGSASPITDIWQRP
jgi:phosphatidylinositol-3-phosphatase